MAAEGHCSSKAASLGPSQPPALRGLPEGKQLRQQISQGVLTEAACVLVLVEGPPRCCGLCLTAYREWHSAPAQAALRVSPSTKQIPWAGRV